MLSIFQFIRDGIIYLIEILLSLLILFFVFSLLFFIFLSERSEEIYIVPFEVNSGKKKYNGKIISEHLIAEMRKIKEIHQQGNRIYEDISLSKLIPDTEKFNAKISNMGYLKIAGMTISVLSIFNVLKQFGPLKGQAQTIRGNLQVSDSEINLIALMEGSRSYGWDINFKIEQSEIENEFSKLIKDLAFMITYDFSKEEYIEKKETTEKRMMKKREGIKAKTCISFKYFTQAIDFYSQYIATKKLESLKNARKSCIKALEEEKNYRILYNLFCIIGFSYFNNRDYICAKDVFIRCIDLETENKYGFIGLGATIVSSDLQEEAFDKSERNKLNQIDQFVWNSIVKYLYQLNLYDEALKAVNKALEIDPKYVVALVNKGALMGKRGNNEEALVEYNIALEINPKYISAWYNKGLSHAKLGDYPEALRAFEKALEIDPKHVTAWANKALTLCRLKQYDEALKADDEELKINPKDAELWFNRACHYSLINKKLRRLLI
jgi:tetratricopeptide (TPR) repeat protein